MPQTADHTLASFLKERRARLDPAALGLPTTRRRTPGLRREEVAQRAHVSATWYTWLEQGRGGAPSADVLDRLSRALLLNADEREHLFLLAQDRPPPVHAPATPEVTAQMQRVLDAMVDTPAIVKTPVWTVVAWNRAAAAVLVDYARLPIAERNVLRILFTPHARDTRPGWEELARTIVATVRRDVVRAGMLEDTRALIDELSAQSADFRAMWAEGDVHADGEGVKRIVHGIAGPLALEYSTFALAQRPDLAMVVFNPLTAADRDKIRTLLADTH
jgi:transcriptional regulator with XRE-family HTH domain